MSNQWLYHFKYKGLTVCYKWDALKHTRGEMFNKMNKIGYIRDICDIIEFLSKHDLDTNFILCKQIVRGEVLYYYECLVSDREEGYYEDFTI